MSATKPTLAERGRRNESSLSFAMVSALLDYDPDSGIIIHKAARSGVRVGTRAGWVSPYGYRIISIGMVKYQASRIAWMMHYGSWPDGEIDHKNGNRDDNRISNLQVVSHRQNLQNLQEHREGRYPGVSCHKGSRRWVSRVRDGGILKYLGSFSTQEEGFIVYAEYVHDILHEEMLPGWEAEYLRIKKKEA